MTVRLDGNVVHLEGVCDLEDAETVAGLLFGVPGRIVDLTQCRRLHAAVAQALLASAPVCGTQPQDHFLRDLLVPALGLRDKELNR